MYRITRNAVFETALKFCHPGEPNKQEFILKAWTRLKNKERERVNPD